MITDLRAVGLFNAKLEIKTKIVSQESEAGAIVDQFRGLVSYFKLKLG